MPNVTKPIAVTCTNAYEGAIVTARNRTTDETTTGVVKSGKAMVDLQNFTSGFTTGDVVEFKIHGTYFGSNTVTTTASTATPQSVTVTMVQTTTTNAPAISF